MKKILLTGGTAIVLLSGAQAFAQDDYYAKDADQPLQGAQYSAPGQEPATRTTTTTRTTSSEQVYNLEPAAGDGGFSDFTGPYVGGDIGYSIGSYELDDSAGPDGDVGLDGWDGGIFAGYGFTHNFSWLGGYAGLELGYEWGGTDGDFAGTEFEKNHTWLISLRPGITAFDDALGYGILGYARTEFEGNGTEEDLDGLVLGAGTEFDTQSPLKLRLEYTYTNYEEADFSGVDFDGHENDVKLGAVFRF